jgi:hypothetical protein
VKQDLAIENLVKRLRGNHKNSPPGAWGKIFAKLGNLLLQKTLLSTLKEVQLFIKIDKNIILLMLI